MTGRRRERKACLGPRLLLKKRAKRGIMDKNKEYKISTKFVYS